MARKIEEVSSSRMVAALLPLVAVVSEKGHAKAEVTVTAGLSTTTLSV